MGQHRMFGSPGFGRIVICFFYIMIIEDFLLQFFSWSLQLFVGGLNIRFKLLIRLSGLE